MGGNFIFLDTMNDITKTKKLRYLQCLLEIIPNHVERGTQFHIYLLLCDNISDEIINDIGASIPLDN